MFGKTKKRTVKNDPTPMAEERIKEMQEMLGEIGRAKRNGFFVVIAVDDVPEGLQAEGASKVTNTNNKVIMSTLMEVFNYTPDDLVKFLLLTKLEDSDD